MRKVRQILKQVQEDKGEIFFVAVVIFIAVFVSFYPSLYEISRSGDVFSDRQFILVHNFAADYHAYLSKITQGVQGHWLVREYFTSEPHQGSLLQIFYLMLGKFGAVGEIWGKGLTPEQIYHLSRIVFGAGWLLAGWFFIKFSFKNSFYQKIAFLIFVFVGNWPKIVTDPNGYGFPFLGQKWETTMVGWSSLDIVKRITFVPHWQAGHILTVLSLLFFLKINWSNWTNKSNWFYWGASVLFGILAGFVLPPTLIIVYVILGLWMCGNFYHSPQNLIVYVIVFFLFTSVSLFYNLWVTQFYPWKALVETDLYVNRIVFPYFEYLRGLGPTSFLGLTGIILVFLFRKERLYWSAFWVLGMFGLIFVFDKFIWWHNQTRFMEVGPELPLAVLSVVTLSVLGQGGSALVGRFMVKTRPSGAKVGSYILFLTFLLFLPSIFLIMISVKAQTDFIDHKLLGSYPALSFGNYVVYPTKDFMEGVKFLKENMTDKDVVLSGPTSGNHIGAYAGKFVYIGHGSQTVRFYSEKLPKTKEFYWGKMTEEQARKFLTDNRISYVFFGPEEKEWGEWVRKRKFLELVYINGEVRIYKVQ